MRDWRGIIVRKGDVVQVQAPDLPAVDGCFAVVTSIHKWGIKADIYLEAGGIAPIRLPKSEFQYVGRCPQKRGAMS